MNKFDKQFVIDNLLNITGTLNPRALKKFNISGEQAYQAFHGLAEPKGCKSCSKPTRLISFIKGYAEFCSKSCVSGNKEVIEKRQNTVLRNYNGGYGSVEITEKKKITSRKNYGVDWARQSKQYLEELKLEWKDVYGVTDFSHTSAAVEKRNATNLKKYGYINPVQNKQIQEKITETNILRYGVKSTLMLNENRQKALSSRRTADVYDLLNDKSWLEANKDVPSTVLSKSFGLACSTVLNYFEKHNVVRSKYTVSSIEQQICNFLDATNIAYETKNRTILNGKEIDIYIPTHNIGIELDGIYWHSDRFIKDPKYHQQKTMLAKQNNVQLLHITDDEINNKFDIVKERLYNKLGKSNRIYARKTEVIEIDNSSYETFVSANHIQGYAPASVRYALIMDNEITAIMSFSKSRFNKNYQWELVRYASKCTVVGGAGKLFKHFVNTITPKSIISYADLRWNTGTMYEKIGMKFSHTTRPNYWYVTDKGLEHRTTFQKHKLKNKLTFYNPSKTEWENMQDNNIYKFWDCGNNVYTWEVNNEN